MTLMTPCFDGMPLRAALACGVVLRVAAGLFAHGLMRPFAGAAINPRSGRVRAR